MNGRQRKRTTSSSSTSSTKADTESTAALRRHDERHRSQQHSSPKKPYRKNNEKNYEHDDDYDNRRNRNYTHYNDDDNNNDDDGINNRIHNDKYRNRGENTQRTNDVVMRGGGANKNDWTAQCIDLERITRYFRTNDMSNLDAETRLLINTIRDICIETHPVDVNVRKRFDNDESLIKHYERLRKELGGTVITDNVFQASFIGTVLPAYAQKFYNKGAMEVTGNALSEAAKQLGLAVQYQVAQAVTTSIPIPLPFSQQLANNYVTLLLKQAQIPSNIQAAVESRKYAQLNVINDLVNAVIDNVFAGGGDYYHYVLNERNRARVVSLKENIAYLAPLSASTNIFQYIAEQATKGGKRPGLFRDATHLTTSTVFGKEMGNANASGSISGQSSCQRALTELAFENESLRRLFFQKLSYKNK
ncbi:gp41 [Lambdina fiscellaria nucleopolyhedrovirus]|uniref:Gp41 n=1 Tax=Lambdina fiscellaria nucleopolyhedrovirus TaxID=1642929 RepID=A0A0E3Z8A5_9ABAC|nr:gp41 [Lambdina fiscellaria nucleopolyhedrovirus]AKC91692.1 gp41 [Lambdina fiscellaria nucleopolyhedrovirus]